jgi:hypothetical protein
MRNEITSGLFVMVLLALCVGCVPLAGIHKAALGGDVAKIGELLDQDPNLVNIMESAGWTPLHFAASQGHKEVAELLLARGANVNARLKYYGGTPLHVAATNGHKSIVALLLEKGARANATDDNEWTPLHRAAIRGDRDAAEVLLAKGANVHAWSNTSVTPIDQATQMGHTEFAKLLRERGRAALPIADDFSGDCHWPSGENERMSFGCDQGVYRVRLKKAGPNHIPQNFGLSAPAVSVEVDASVRSGRGTDLGSALLGIGCLSHRWHGYMGIMSTNGAWAIMRVEKEFAPLAGTKPGSIPGLGRTNRLRIVCAGASGGATVVSFFVNGRSVGSVEDESGQASFNGVVLYTDTFLGDVVFERFVAREPSR